MKKILFAFPTAWDARQLEACGAAWRDRFETGWTGPDDESRPWDFDVVAFIEDSVRSLPGTLDGIISSSDYPGATVAAAIAARLGLSGPDPKTVICCSHKYYSRVRQSESVPEATPRFQLIDPLDPEQACGKAEFPCFIKPVKGAFSMMSRRLNSADEMREFLARPAVQEFARDYMQAFNQLVGRLTDFEVGGSYFLAEELLKGTQVTVDGFSRGDEIEILGIVDSVMHGDTGSFERFDYPSSLGAAVQSRMGDIAARAIRHLGLRDALFNIEMIHDPGTGSVHIIEINPRISGQFGDLYQKVDGTNTYEIALALAAGERPRMRRRKGIAGVACSRPLRIYEPVVVARAPDAERRRAVEEEFPGTIVWLECAEGDKLANFERMEDGQSCRYAIVNTGAPDRPSLLARLDAIRDRLGFEMRPL